MGSFELLDEGEALMSSGGHRVEGVPSTVQLFDSDREEIWRLEQPILNQLNYRTIPFRYAWPLE